MCDCLEISRSTYYYVEQHMYTYKELDPLTDIVVQLFNDNQRVYGTRKLKVELKKKGYQVSRRRIARIMTYNGLVSAYSIKKYKVVKSKVNEATVNNELNREFGNRLANEVIVSDLTYVRVKDKWNYICVLLDLHNREIIGYSCGRHKDSALVYEAFQRVKIDLRNVVYFHTDRGSEFDNYLIDEVLEYYGIKRSLSNKGCPYDNAVAEATYKIIKTEFVRPRCFESLEQLKLELAAYVYWFNNKRIHSTLGYLAPVEYRQISL